MGGSEGRGEGVGTEERKERNKHWTARDGSIDECQSAGQIRRARLLRGFRDGEDGVRLDGSAFHDQFRFGSGVGVGSGCRDGAGEYARLRIEVDGFDGVGAGEHGDDGVLCVIKPS